MVTGNFNNTVDFNPNGDPEELSSSSATDGYVLKMTNPDLVNSIDELNSSQFTIFPNPATDQLSISVDQEMKADQIVIYDLVGKAVCKSQSMLYFQLKHSA